MPEIVRATPEDAEGLRACVLAAYARYLGIVDDLPPVADGLAEDIAERLVWVVRHEGNIMAGIVAGQHEGVVHIANLAVRPEAAGQGLARALVATVEAHAAQLGADSIDLTTHRLMPDNVAIYERLGWQVTGSEGNRIFMSKPVKQAL
ncbi:GNAT family N-acetyltransferase [Pseudovibrio sp. SPO723]|uniref:GNAT family N-acetyltransferase n=1 Tax=Nesiotobacter zosterae TaxID=392721 RepID=UPI0029C1F4EA|nr:GNAT family N-acetyltransferase [Pseudovibrio sp. SPO723]MDX5593071.1 GNAT family N-acetyltransferase [Pseudovibrio sp. SPO723]